MDIEKDIHFPKCGIDRVGAISAQPARAAYQGQYARTTYFGRNVRGFDTQGKWRGGSRAGLRKYIAAQVAGTICVIQDLNAVTGATYVEGSMQSSQAGRVVTLVAVSQGNVKRAHAGDTSWTAATNATGSTPPLNYNGVIFSAVNQQKLWFADGVNWCYYDPSTNRVERWTASAGTLPVDSDGNKPRLIETWRGRTILSGLLKDPQNWFMSNQDDPRNFDYSPESPSPTDAVAGNNSPLGLIGDIVTGMVPYSDDILFMGGDHTLFMFNGDPMAGGSIIQVSDQVGMAWGRAWCVSSSGIAFFMSNQMRVYALQPGAKPERISYGIDSLIEDLDPGVNSIRLAWNEKMQGFHVFITPLEEPAATDHYFFEQRSGAWWQDRFADTDMNPAACCVFDGNEPTDRTVVLGSWDGYVRAVDDAATSDDGTEIESEVWIGPFTAPTFNDLVVREMQAVLDEASGDVDFEIYRGRTAQAALDSEVFRSGTLTKGRNVTRQIETAGHAIYLRLTSTNQWAMEAIRVRLGDNGPVRMRGR